VNEFEGLYVDEQFFDYPCHRDVEKTIMQRINKADAKDLFLGRVQCRFKSCLTHLLEWARIPREIKDRSLARLYRETKLFVAACFADILAKARKPAQ
jgi:hypothetical protein